MRRLILGLLFFGFSIHAHAGTVNLKFVNAYPGYSDGQYVVYPYNFSIDGSASLTSMMCDDFVDEIFLGESWQANVYTMADIISGKGQMNPLDAGSLAALNGQTDKRAYEEAAWLFQQLITNVNETTAVDTNHTVWSLFSSVPHKIDPNVISLFHSAAAATAGLSDTDAENLFSNVRIYTPIDGTQSQGGRPQEFIGVTETDSRTPVPEPGTISLVLVGLIGLATIVWQPPSKARV